MKSEERTRAIRRAPQLFSRILVDGQYDFIYDQMPFRIRSMGWPQRINLIRSGFNFIHRRLKPWSYPLHMQFELVNYCQLRCPVCPTGTKELARKPMAMEPELFRSVLHQVGPRLITMSLWGWGESLLHPSLGEFLKAARRYNAAILLSTNGQNLDCKEVVQAILDNPPTFLIVALDGLTDESNTRFRVGAHLEPALRGVEMLLKRRLSRGQQFPLLHMRFIAMTHNQQEILEAEAFARAHGFDMLSIRLLSLIDSEAGIQRQSSLSINLPEAPPRAGPAMISARNKEYICMQPFWYPSLFADGTLVACEQDFNARLPLGVLSPGTPFAAIWSGRKSCQVRKQIRDSFHTLSFCRNCPAYARNRTDTSVRAIWLNRKIQNPVTIGEKAAWRG